MRTLPKNIDQRSAVRHPDFLGTDDMEGKLEELRIASKGGVADYSGITYEKIDRQMGVFWPCYSEDPKTGKPGKAKLEELGMADVARVLYP